LSALHGKENILHPAPYFLEAKASIIRSYEYHKNNAIDTIFFMGDDAATIDWISSE
jgi:hypothetical protein